MSEKNEIVVVIVGAGPAGIATAIELKKNSDFEVIILEKNSKIDYKVCAGGIDPDLSKLGLPNNIIDKVFRKVKMFTPKQEVVIEEEDIAATVDRKRLHEVMAEEAIKLGVKILFNKHVVKIDNNSVITSAGEKFDFDHLVGADGSNSIIRKELGLKTKKMLIAFQYIIPGVYPDMEFYFGFDESGPSYRWIFPQKNVTSVGTGYDPNLSKKTTTKELRRNFDLWCKEKFNLDNAKFEAFTINYDYQGYRFRKGKIFLVGDAAGFASGLTGEGIGPGIESGRDVARKIVDPKYKCTAILKILIRKKCGESFSHFIAMNETVGRFATEFCIFLTKWLVKTGIMRKLF